LVLEVTLLEGDPAARLNALKQEHHGHLIVPGAGESPVSVNVCEAAGRVANALTVYRSRRASAWKKLGLDLASVKSMPTISHPSAPS
jgi:hypothetical protein